MAGFVVRVVCRYAPWWTLFRHRGDTLSISEFISGGLSFRREYRQRRMSSGQFGTWRTREEWFCGIVRVQRRECRKSPCDSLRGRFDGRRDSRRGDLDDYCLENRRGTVKIVAIRDDARVTVFSSSRSRFYGLLCNCGAARGSDGWVRFEVPALWETRGYRGHWHEERSVIVLGSWLIVIEASITVYLVLTS